MTRDFKGAVIDKEALYSLEREEGDTTFNPPNLAGRLDKRRSIGQGESRHELGTDNLFQWFQQMCYIRCCPAY